jgi:predicted dehydrogenase
MSTLRMGLIGCGVMGRSLSESAKGLDSAEMVWVSDLDEEKGEALASDLGCDFVADYAVAFERKDVDAVMIATPGFLHEEPAVAAAEAGLHVFSEKPLAPTLVSCDRIIEAAKENGVALGVGQVCRFHPVHRKVRDLVRSGDFGEPTVMTVHRLGSGFKGIWRVPWRTSRAQSGGTLMEVNAHEIDFLRFVAGCDATSVFAVGGNYVNREIDFPDAALVTISFENGAVGSLHSSDVSLIGGYGGRIDCEKGSLVFPRFWGDGAELTYQIGDEEPVSIPAKDLAGEMSPVAQEIDAFARAVMAGETPPVTGEDGRAVVAIAEGAYDSVVSGKPVTL